MTVRPAHPAPASSDVGGPADLARLLAGARVYCAGRLAALDAEQFADVLGAYGAEVAATVDAAAVAVVGDGHWPLALPGAPNSRVRVLEDLDRRAALGSLVVLNEREFLANLTASGERAAGDAAGSSQLFSTARLTELLNVSRERIRGWVKAGLVEPVREEHGVWYFDFRQVTAARTLCDLAAAGVGTERIRRTLALLRKFMPGLGRPLEQLAAMDRDGTLLVRLAEGDLAEADGQFHFDFAGGGGATRPGSADASTASPMRIAPGPRSAADWAAQGLEQEREGFLDEAAASYRQALLAGGPDAQTCLNLANVLRGLGNRAQALERYAQAAETRPDFADAWNNMGTLLVELGKPDDAVAAFRRAVAADPDDARAHYNLADTLDEMGRGAEAEPHWRAYLLHDPASKWGEYARAKLG